MLRLFFQETALLGTITLYLFIMTSSNVYHRWLLIAWRSLLFSSVIEFQPFCLFNDTRAVGSRALHVNTALRPLVKLNLAMLTFFYSDDILVRVILDRRQLIFHRRQITQPSITGHRPRSWECQNGGEATRNRSEISIEISQYLVHKVFIVSNLYHII